MRDRTRRASCAASARAGTRSRWCARQARAFSACDADRCCASSTSDSCPMPTLPRGTTSPSASRGSPSVCVTRCSARGGGCMRCCYRRRWGWSDPGPRSCRSSSACRAARPPACRAALRACASSAPGTAPFRPPASTSSPAASRAPRHRRATPIAGRCGWRTGSSTPPPSSWRRGASSAGASSTSPARRCSPRRCPPRPAPCSAAPSTRRRASAPTAVRSTCRVPCSASRPSRSPGRCRATP